MSLQKGNSRRSRPQKHQNSTVFKNDMHDTSKRTKMLNGIEIHGVCRRCKDIIDWKIKYKKYKPLTAPRSCTRCHCKSIVAAYRTVCRPCASAGDVCEKCGEKKTDVVARATPTQQERDRLQAELQGELKTLPERRRRTLQRFICQCSMETTGDMEQMRLEFIRQLSSIRARLDAGQDSDDDAEDSDGSGLDEDDDEEV